MQNNFPLPLGAVDGLKVARDAQQRMNRMNAMEEQRRQNPVEQKFDPIVYVDADEASRAYANFQLQPDEEVKLKDCCERLFERQEQESEMVKILATADEHEKRTLLGYETKVLPSLLGVADTFKHVPGTLEIIRERIADLERLLPLLRVRAAQYVNLRDSFRPWPVYKIARDRSERLYRQNVVAGRSVQRRGPN
jgi:hypothetical protein